MGKTGPIATDVTPARVRALESQVAALDELLAVQEGVVRTQSAKLEHTLQEHRDAKDAANASEERLRDLIATINDWIWEMNAEGVYTYASPRVRDLLGYEPEEMVGKRFFDFMPQEEATILAAVHEELVASRMPIGPREATLIHRDGHLVSIEVSGIPFFAPDGSLAGYRGVDRDTTGRKQVEKALRGSQERYRVISERSPHGILIADSETRQFVYANPCMCRLLGYTEKELLQLGVADIHPKDSLGRVVSEFESQARGEKTLAAELPCLRKDGTVFYADVTAGPIMLDGGQECLVGFFADVTMRKRAEEALRESEGRLKAILDSVQTGILIVDPETHVIVDINPVVARLFGVPKGQIVGSVCHKYICPAEVGRCPVTDLGQTVDDSERVMLTAAGGRSPIIKTVVPVTLGGRRHILESFMDITERKQAEERLHFLATHDPLTGLPNRDLFQDRLTQAIALSRRSNRLIALLVLDLDHLKQVNDSMGHLAGDLLLKSVAESLMGCVRECDTVARLGGDEFVIVLPEIQDSRQAASVAERVLEVLSKPFILGGSECIATASIGISLCPTHGEDPETLLQNADAAMYRAKERRNCYEFYAAYAPAVG